MMAAQPGTPAMFGYIPSGKQPRQFAPQTGGRDLFVSDNGSAQVQWLNLSGLS